MRQRTALSVGARSSPLSKKQVEEVEIQLQQTHPHIYFEPYWFETTGDKDKLTSLTQVIQSNFFTKEIDEAQLQGECRISIHSAKDVPSPLCPKLKIVATTQGVDPKDVLVLPIGTTIADLPYPAFIGTSSLRRENALKKIRDHVFAHNIRGTIHERLALLDAGQVHGLIMAEAALIRLNLTHINRVPLSIEPEPLQGRLAIIARHDDDEMKDLFSVIDYKG